MNAWDILAIVLCIGVIALVGFLIPILIQVKDLLKMAETTVTRIEKEVEPVIQNVSGITQNFEGITGAANSFVHRKPSTEPGMIDNLKVSMAESVDVVKHHYAPLAYKEAGRYLRALKIGWKAGYHKFQHNKRPDPIKIIKPSQALLQAKLSPIAEDIVIVEHHIIKR